ncbi:MAG TPA: CHAD domain-containing protein [Aggregatilineaceae bacterium]|nr:CHAD domain-containing protein [Aggregatilineaceae bacterium]
MLLSLTDQELNFLQQINDSGSAKDAQRAQIIMLAGSCSTYEEIAKAASSTLRQVQYWLRAWEKRGVSIFPDSAPETILASVASVTSMDSVAAAPAVEEVPVDLDLVETAEPPAPRLPLQLAETVGVLPDDPMAEAGRKVLLFHFERMLLNEHGSRTGADIEAVHDMRVATRRMRSAFRLFRPYYERKIANRYIDQLRRTGTTLGAVRDLEVLIDKARRYADAHPDHDLTPLLENWQRDLDKKRGHLIKRLDSSKFDKFVRKFHAFLTTPGSGALPQPDPGTAYQVRHAAPRILYALYERVRSYETALGDMPIETMHALRIEFKHLRYALEFFAEVLGPEGKQVIKEVKGMQDLLGDLNDAEVAHLKLRTYLDRYNEKYSGTPSFMRPNVEGLFHYLLYLDSEKLRLLQAFPAAWEKFQSGDIRRSLALSVAVL